MATRQPDAEAAALINRVADVQQGVPPEQAAAAAPAATDTQPVEAAAPTNKQTVEDKAQIKGAPKTEASKMSDPAATFSVDFGDGEMRDLTSSQIAGTFKRYAAQNLSNIEKADADKANAPIRELMEQLTQRANGDPKQAADAVMHALKSTYGAEAKDTAATAPVETTSFEKWEEENAASLPPGYKEMFEGQRNTQNQLAELTKHMRTIVQASGMMAKEGQAMENETRGREADAMKKGIVNNLRAAQSAANIDENDVPQLIDFAAQRGYTMEDFADPSLSLTIAKDYRNNKNEGEFERLAALTERRTAATGSLGSAPSSGGPAPEAGPGADRLNDLVNKGMSGQF